MVGIELVDASDVAIKGGKPKSGNIDTVAKGNADSFTKSNAEQKNTAVDVKTLKLKQDIYYGPKNSNKNKFVRLYKKIGLVWREGVNIDGNIVDCWCNADKSQYIIKIPEEGEFKRFKFHGCNEIYNYFLSLGAISFELSDNDEITGPSKKNEIIDDEYKFVGADLWAHYRTEQLLKDMPLNWGVKWK